MTRVARLTAPPAGDSSLRVAGMSVLLRQLLSLQDAGITEVIVEGVPEADLPRDSRLTLTVRSGSGGPATGEVLSARLGLVWHRLLPRRLVRSGYRGDLEQAPLEPDEFVLADTGPEVSREAEDRLLQSLLKATDGLISRSINRRISLRITRLLLDTSITPNQMTLIAAVFGVAAIVVVVAGGAAWLVPGAFLLQLQSILDGCDGEISRLKYIRSRLGEWLDQVLDDVVNLGFFAAAGWAMAGSGSSVTLLVTIAGTAMHIIYQIALYAALIVRGGGSGSVASIRWSGQLDPQARTPAKTSGGFLKKVKETIEIAGRRDFFTFLYLPAAMIGMTEIALYWCAFIFIGTGAVTSLEWILRGGPRPVQRAS
jgi:phosphatidylglycerophosphate synthase